MLQLNLADLQIDEGVFYRVSVAVHDERHVFHNSVLFDLVHEHGYFGPIVLRKDELLGLHIGAHSSVREMLVVHGDDLVAGHELLVEAALIDEGIMLFARRLELFVGSDNHLSGLQAILCQIFVGKNPVSYKKVVIDTERRADVTRGHDEWVPEEVFTKLPLLLQPVNYEIVVAVRALVLGFQMLIIPLVPQVKTIHQRRLRVVIL